MVHYLWLVFAACLGFAVGFFACAVFSSGAHADGGYLGPEKEQSNG